jgi:hypothetical protein
LTGQTKVPLTTKFGDLKSSRKLDQAKAEKKLVNYDFKEASNWSDILIFITHYYHSRLDFIMRKCLVAVLVVVVKF